MQKGYDPREAMKIALHDCKEHVTDPEFMTIRAEDLFSVDYAQRQRASISRGQAIPEPGRDRTTAGDTAYLCVADAEGNVVSFINSILYIPSLEKAWQRRNILEALVES